MSVTPAVMRRLMRELTELRTNPPEGIRAVTSDDNMLDVTGILQGPEGTPYAGGYFRVKFRFTEEFPAAPPKCWFATKIFHPNVSSAGEICVNTLKKDWQSKFGIAHILVTVKCLLIYPNPDSALDEEAGKLLQENYESYCSRARLITQVHATPKVPPPEFSDSASLDSTPPTSAVVTISPATENDVPSATKSNSPVSTHTHPLQQSASNTLVISNPLAALVDEKVAARVSPSPLGTADSNVAAKAPAPKAVKRGATTGGVAGAEKRKKALKRL